MSSNEPKIEVLNQHLGWNPVFQTEYELLTGEFQRFKPARVLSQHASVYVVATREGDQLMATIRGRLLHKTIRRFELPTVGDWVLVDHLKGENKGVIEYVFARKSCLLRKAVGSGGEAQALAANVDTAFIVTSLNADLNLRRLERYLALVWDSGASPAILLTKADLVAKPEASLGKVHTLAPGVPTFMLSSVTRQGYESLRNFVESGKTYVAIGSSGVGKSTLVNELAGKEILATGSIRSDDDKGRHTTTHRQLVILDESKAIFIDTPGMRELGLHDAESGVGQVFADIEELTLSCRFTNCQHGGEPGCSVRAAVESGSLDPDRVQSFDKLSRELAHQRRKVDKAAAAQEKDRWKKIHKDMKARKKLKQPD